MLTLSPALILAILTIVLAAILLVIAYFVVDILFGGSAKGPTVADITARIDGEDAR